MNGDGRHDETNHNHIAGDASRTNSEIASRAISTKWSTVHKLISVWDTIQDKLKCWLAREIIKCITCEYFLYTTSGARACRRGKTIS